MENQYLFDPIKIIYGSKKISTEDAVFIKNKKIIAFSEEARNLGKSFKVKKYPLSDLILGPCLVDPYSRLEEPLNSLSETLEEFRKKAASAGYGQIALLPKASTWRDQPEKLFPLNNHNENINIHFWGGFTIEGKGEKLSSHRELINKGAIGLADDDYMQSYELLKKGFELGEINSNPILIAPRDRNIQGKGFARESIEALRAGWNPDPIASETIPLGTVLELHRQYPDINIRLMNISTASAIKMILNSITRPMASVCWFHLIADQSNLCSTDAGWNISPSLGTSEDRQVLKTALLNNVLSGIAVCNTPLNDCERIKPFNERAKGLSGHELVLSSLWEELVLKSNWPIEKLWNALSFGPSRILNLPEEELTIGSKRWVLFDPKQEWFINQSEPNMHLSSNYPWRERKMIGKILKVGLS